MRKREIDRDREREREKIKTRRLIMQVKQNEFEMSRHIPV